MEALHEDLFYDAFYDFLIKAIKENFDAESNWKSLLILFSLSST